MARAAAVSRDALVAQLEQAGRPMHVGELASRLGVGPRDRAALREAIDELVFRGVLAQLAGQRYRLRPQAVAERSRAVEGVLHVNARGFGFVGQSSIEQELYVPAEAMAGALHGDRVRARVVATSARGREGAIVEVVQRANRRVVGVLRMKGASQWLEPDDQRIRGPIVLRPALTGAPTPPQARAERSWEDDLRAAPADGLAAVALITRFPRTADENAEGELLAVLGEPGDPDVEVGKILLGHGVVEEHGAEAVRAAEAFGAELDEAACAERDDLTQLPLVTIDPEDARDHDDAVYAERLEEGGYLVWVAIADVSHYVTTGSALDREALERGCSAYLPDRAIPMLPRALSSGLCSLLPDTDRLCLFVQIELRATGQVRRYRLGEGVMRSHAKLSYEAVAHALGFTSEGPRSRAADELREELRALWEIATLLRQRRLRRGALDFELPDVQVHLDPEEGVPLDVRQRTADPGVRKAYRLVEELMLLANETVAAHLVARDAPAVFRVHAAPDLGKLDRFAALLAELDIDIGPEPLERVASEPKSLGRLLRKLASHPSRSVLHGLLLRAMAQAGYDTVNVGHFGLASPAYLHFTSPIRRYPDLLVHRIVKALLHGAELDVVRLPEPADDEAACEPEVAEPSPLQRAARMSSERERVVMEVERQVVDLYRALYMRGHVGERFVGRVSSLTPGGVFVQLAAPFVDVLVSMDALGNGGYELDESGLRAVARRSGDRVMLGDELALVVEDVSLARRTVYGRRVPLELGLEPEERQKRRRSSRQDERPEPRRPRRAHGRREPPPGGRKRKR